METKLIHHESERRKHVRDISQRSDMSLASQISIEPNHKVRILMLTSMCNFFMFGMNQAAFGIVQSFDDFRRDWCEDNYLINTTDAEAFSCRDDAATAANENWQHRFVLWTAAWVSIGAAGGGLLIGPHISNNYGRRIAMIVGSILCIVGCSITSMAPRNLAYLFMAGRFLTGLACGVAVFVTPIMVSEIGSPFSRNLSGTYFQFTIVLGSTIAVLISSILDNHWRICLALPAIPAILSLALGVFFVPESPLFKIRNKMGDEAVNALQEALSEIRLGDVDREAMALYRWFRETQPTDKTSWRALLRGDIAMLTFVAVGLQIGQQMTCINIFLYYAASIFERLKFDNTHLYACLWNLCMLLTMVYIIVRTRMYDSEYSGRRGRILAQASVMGPALLIVGLSCTLEVHAMANVMLAFYGVSYQMVWGASFRDDIWSPFSGNEREKVMAIALFAQSVCDFAVAAGSPFLYTWSGEYTMFVLAAINVVTFVAVYELTRRTRPHFDEATASRRERRAKGRKAVSNVPRRGASSPSPDRRTRSISTEGWGQFLALNSPESTS